MRDLLKLSSAVFAALALAAGQASAHFIFVVPGPGADKAKVIMSETLTPDEAVDSELISKTTLEVRGADGSDTKVLLSNKKEHSFGIVVPGDGVRVVHGDLVYGVEDHGPKPFLLTYHPKTILGNPFDSKTTLGEKTAKAEIVASGKPGAVVFQVLFAGKPAAAAKATVVFPDGKEKAVTTDADGKTPAFTEAGRFGVWARCVEPGSGEMNGKAYTESRHYPTLVLDVAGGDLGQAQPAAAAVNGGASRPEIAAKPALQNVVPSTYPNMPEKTSSFGAAAADGWVYVYGGHTAPTHHYDVNAVSGKFHRLKLDGGKTWEPLESGTALQGMNIVSHGGKIYRVGGMQPRNKVGDKEDNYSISDVVVFDPATQKWTNLTPLPEPRSSHDIVAFGDKLLVLGGWNMKGTAGGNEWPKNALMLDLSASTPQWTSIPQPFQRRALIAAVHDSKVFVIGGFDEHDDPTLEVNIFDPAKSEWTKGPDIPGRSRFGFAPAACTLDGKLYVSVMDGSMYRLDDAGKKWEPVAKTTPRIVHRLIPHNGQILVLGGADRGGNFDLVELVKPEAAPIAQGRAD
jgi:N-acetylneuraminic acid mutarotase